MGWLVNVVDVQVGRQGVKIGRTEWHFGGFSSYGG